MNKDDSEHIEQGEQKGLFTKLVGVLRLGGSPDTTEKLEHEIQELLEEGEEQGLISSLEEKMINSIFDFRDTTAVEIMTPAVEIVSADVANTLDDLINSVIENGFTRTPIFKGNSDRIVGIVHVKDLLKICNSKTAGQQDVEECMNPVYFISEQKPVVDLLKEFQKRQIHMAVVTDEFGTVRGLITLEDILEEIVGEIDDEFDVNEEHIETVDENTIVVQARTDVEIVEEKFEIELPDGPYESIGGLIIHLLGRLATVGDQVEVADLSFLVKAATERHIQSVQITKMNRDEK